MDDRVVAKLSRVIVFLSLAFAEQIAAARTQVLAEPVSGAILNETADRGVSAGELKRLVAAATGQSERILSRRLTELTSSGVASIVWLRTSREISLYWAVRPAG